MRHWAWLLVVLAAAALLPRGHPEPAGPAPIRVDGRRLGDPPDHRAHDGCRGLTEVRGERLDIRGRTLTALTTTHRGVQSVLGPPDWVGDWRGNPIWYYALDSETGGTTRAVDPERTAYLAVHMEWWPGFNLVAHFVLRRTPY